MADARYVVGIDLGTSNCAVAYAAIEEAKTSADVESLALPQLVAPGQIEFRANLPSAIYLPAADELPPEAIALPFRPNPAAAEVIGEFARAQGIRAPGRLVVSAKSWLCHPTVDREAELLPTGAPLDLKRMSPVEASARLLSHIRDAWDHRFPEAPLRNQDVVLAVPASFDAIARKLTLDAARQAGLADGLTLIEEPQAAFYHCHAQHADALQGERLVLVVDVGGGTTDLTLIQASLRAGAPYLERIAVGDHIMLGGDNMDMTLARVAEQRMGVRLDPVRWSLLCQSCRAIKEAALSDGAAGISTKTESIESWKVSVPGRGRRLIGGQLTCELTRDDIGSLVLDGFTPQVAADARPQRSARQGLAQLGLPYEQDAAISRHVAAFLARHGDARPDAVLLNGGVFNSPLLAERLLQVIRSWGAKAELLPADALDRAVARGAAAFGLVKRGVGKRIAGGAARAVYAEVATEGGETQGLCLIPRGQAADAPVQVDRGFELIVGRPVQFQLRTTSDGRVDEAGALVALDDSFHPLPPIQVLLPHREGKMRVPVTLEAVLTEVGALEVACLATNGDERWQLDFDLRSGGRRRARTSAAGTEVTGGLTAAARDRVTETLRLIYGKASKTPDAKEVRQLFKTLQAEIGTRRETWSLPMLRQVWEMVMEGRKKRRRSAEHEVMFYTLAGYCLRPGFGYPQDEWRVQDLWALYTDGVQYHKEPRVWHAWWIMWRRVVGGLTAEQQTLLLAEVRRFARGEQVEVEGKVIPRGKDEMLRLVASLERIGPVQKAEWGEWLLKRVEGGTAPAFAGWALARLGARVPFSGAAHNVVDPSVAEDWAHRLLNLNWKKHPQAGYAVAHLCRRTDDRLRDVDESMRARATAKLKQSDLAPLAALVADVVHLEAGDEGRFVGDALPAGLVLSD
ncbi:MAG: molecular chaperone DnaK (HSP70) [Myxococcota bacterium]|jgi:molecular chaperone DnaK (HSP70)